MCHRPQFDQLVPKAQMKLENEIACISLNPPSNQPVSEAEPDLAAMETDEGREEQPLDSLVAVGTWTDMTVRYVALDCRSRIAHRVVLFSSCCQMSDLRA